MDVETDKVSTENQATPRGTNETAPLTHAGTKRDRRLAAKEDP